MAKVDMTPDSIAYSASRWCGDSGGRLGELLPLDDLTLLQGCGGVIMLQRLASAEQFDQIMAQVASELASPQVRCIKPIFIAYGQRQC
jgi:hypothetical protein